VLGERQIAHRRLMLHHLQLARVGKGCHVR
jgi:hypothetical protein